LGGFHMMFIWESFLLACFLQGQKNYSGEIFFEDIV